MERIDGTTPAGGDYSEVYYFDDNENAVDKSKATHVIVRECMKDGTLIRTTRGEYHGF